ncbi:MAG: hypothetical protein LC730_05135 [Acidobacteria bacterium]|nr:hypothetical protein [Acidobacteriota bacterium]MCA1608829.1 hypothetical protein [Acidobacteriota bacterium]
MSAVGTQRKCIANNLGLVCITTTDAVRYKRATRKRLMSFPEAGQAEILRNLYAANASVLENAVNFCHQNQISLYRITSDIFQFSDEQFGAEIFITDFSKRSSEIGARATANGLRLVLRPGAYCRPNGLTKNKNCLKPAP